MSEQSKTIARLVSAALAVVQMGSPMELVMSFINARLAEGWNEDQISEALEQMRKDSSLAAHAALSRARGA
jgi:hypothetical protein